MNYHWMPKTRSPKSKAKWIYLFAMRRSRILPTNPVLPRFNPEVVTAITIAQIIIALICSFLERTNQHSRGQSRAWGVHGAAE
ncbi:protein of unknown function [Candidatus Filomicrobium marinum]|nr:protein of unknown function [Candidatus Filomicrobium marinum]